MNKTFQKALASQQSGFDSSLEQMKSSFDSLSNEALLKNQQDFLELAKGRFQDQEKQHISALEGKKELIDQRLQTMSESMTESLNTVPTEFEREPEQSHRSLWTNQQRDLKESNETYLNRLSDKSAAQTKEHFTKNSKIQETH